MKRETIAQALSVTALAIYLLQGPTGGSPAAMPAGLGVALVAISTTILSASLVLMVLMARPILGRLTIGASLSALLFFVAEAVFRFYPNLSLGLTPSLSISYAGIAEIGVAASFMICALSLLRSTPVRRRLTRPFGWIFIIIAVTFLSYSSVLLIMFLIFLTHVNLTTEDAEGSHQ